MNVDRFDISAVVNNSLDIQGYAIAHALNSGIGIALIVSSEAAKVMLFCSS